MKASATQARDLAAAIADAGRRLREASPPGGSWQGRAASSFLATVAKEGVTLECGAAAFATAAPALSTLAEKVQEAQVRIKALAARIRAAEGEAKRAEAQVQLAADRVRDAQAARNPMMPSLGPADPFAALVAPPGDLRVPRRGQAGRRCQGQPRHRPGSGHQGSTGPLGASAPGRHPNR
ncbi:MAG: hypothetical protein M3N28_02240 [Actinomycetota bacterium]|nr:hypothetical protein [Actinomycetota bacterium]